MGKSDQREQYSVGYRKSIIEELATRSAKKEAAFFLPYLRSNMRLLDCGCGPGTLTVDLATVVASGNVVGIDIKDEQFTLGKKQASEKGVKNIHFQIGNIYKLPFSDNSFDAVFIHALLYHLSEVEKALAEVYRVLKPGGLVEVRDTDYSGDICTPACSIVENAWKMFYKLLECNGGNPFLGREHRGLLRKVGFVDIKATASYDCYGTSELTHRIGKMWIDFILQPHNAEFFIKKGWAEQKTLEEICTAILAWSKHPNAFYGRARCEAVGWKNSS